MRLLSSESSARSLLGSSTPLRRAPALGTASARDPHLCEGERRSRQGLPGVCYGAKHQCRWRAGRHGAHSAGKFDSFAGDTERPSWRVGRLSQRHSPAPGEAVPGWVLERLHPARFQVCPSSAPATATETCFYLVKMFSHWQSPRTRQGAASEKSPTAGYPNY
jgi:hypothetical protein